MCLEGAQDLLRGNGVYIRGTVWIESYRPDLWKLQTRRFAVTDRMTRIDILDDKVADWLSGR